MDFFCRCQLYPRRLAIFPGTFNPPTNAHLALAGEALRLADEVVFVLPRAFPHKPYIGASFEERIVMLREALPPDQPYSIAACDGGLFVEIAAECRAAYGPAVDLSFLCGRDAAERILNWDYGRPGVVADMLSRFALMVASRHGIYDPPEEFRHRIHLLGLDPEWDQVSATDVREKVRLGESWKHLVPETIAGRVMQIYARLS